MRPQSVFRSPLAGRWYPADAGRLRHELDGFWPHPAPIRDPGVCAVVVPHAGYAYSGRIAGGVYAHLDPSVYERVVVVGPSHYVPLRHGVSILSVSGYQTPLGTSPADVEWIREARGLDGVLDVRDAHEHEHSDQIQLPMIQHYLGLDKRVVCVVAGSFDAASRERFARRFRTLLDRRTLLVASTDFTHYGAQFGYLPFADFGPLEIPRKLAELDSRVLDAFASRDGDRLCKVLDETGATVCGREVLSMLLALRPEGAAVVRAGYATSGELTGDWSHSVSYAGALVKGFWENPV